MIQIEHMYYGTRLRGFRAYWMRWSHSNQIGGFGLCGFGRVLNVYRSEP